MGWRKVGKIEYYLIYGEGETIGRIDNIKLNRRYQGKKLSYTLLNIAFENLTAMGATRFDGSRVMGQHPNTGIVKAVRKYGFTPKFNPESLTKENLQKIKTL